MQPQRVPIAPSQTMWKTPEHELLVLTSRRYVDADAQARIAQICQSKVDWPLVMLQADRHGVVALLYFNLRNYAFDVVPEPVMSALKQTYHASARHNLYLLGELLKVINQLERRNIAAITFKGPVLAVTAFGDVSLREFSDLDILIRERDIAAACDALEQLGLRCTHHPRWVNAYLRFGHELDFVGADARVRVDLQWRFAKKWLAFPVDHEAIWERSTRLGLGGALLRQPHVEDSLLILCAHPYRHCWSSLKWVSDLSAHIQAFETQIEWTRVLEQSRTEGGLRVLGLGLWLARELGALRVPEVMEQVLRDDAQIEKLGRQTIARLFADTRPIGPHGSFGFFATIAFYLRARERLREKLPVMAPLFAHGEYLARRYAYHYRRRLFG